jgi:hypothetical protein
MGILEGAYGEKDRIVIGLEAGRLTFHPQRE